MIQNALNAIFTFFTDLVKFTLDGILYIFKTFFYLIFDGLLTTVSAIFTAIDLSQYISSYAMSWAGLPPQFIWFVNAVSLPAGILMITAAIGIRMSINLIPSVFTRI